jgi:CheY-like chemotaxis protein
VTAVNLNDVVLTARTLLRRLLEERIVIATNLTTDLHPVMADATDIEQILINLSVNARDAMPQGGELRIETHNVDLDARDVAEHPGATAGAHVMLCVADTGTGMTPDVKSKIFDAFFTTKARGEGTGLGLATVNAIVTRLGGYISVDTAQGQGTVFRIYLPRATRTPEPATSTVQPIGSPELIGSETILLVEDEDGVRGFASKALRRHGYQVLEASSADAAMSLLEQRPAPIHLLVTDVVLPGIDGRELARRVMHDRPRTPVLFTTGYVDRDLNLEAFQSSISLLDKPFTARALLTKIRELLDRAAISAADHR